MTDHLVDELRNEIEKLRTENKSLSELVDARVGKECEIA